MSKNFYNLLTDRAIITIKGIDRFKFLQSIITNDINKIIEQKIIYSLLLNPQGRYFSDFFIIAVEDYFLIDCHTNRINELIIKLNKYKLRSKVEIIDTQEEYQIISVIGKIEYNSFSSLSYYPDPRNLNMGHRIIINKNQLNDFISKNDLTDQNYNYDELRINHYIPEGEKDLISDKSYPLEYKIEKLGAIDFNKGCYIGQELTARTTYLGVIRKELYYITSKEFLPQNGTNITIGDQKIGRLNSTYKNIGLALIRTEDYLANTNQLIKAQDVILNCQLIE